MIKTIIASLLVTFATFSSCPRNEPTPGGSPSPAPSGSEALAQTGSEVLIFFSGQMVFHKKGDDYEVGILHRSQGNHKFEVAVDGNDIHANRLPSLESRWTLDTVPAQSSPVPHLGEQSVQNRRPDTQANQSHFGWIIDLEEFHSDLPQLEPGHLKPIIDLPYGQLSTRYKSYDLVRWQGGKPNEPPRDAPNFGFVPEQITLSLRLLPNQKLVLRDEQGTEFVLIPNPTQSSHFVTIQNLSDHSSGNSDFHAYYDVFNVPKDKQYHFTANTTANREHPRNPFPGYIHDDLSRLSTDAKTTCCMMACTAVKTQQDLR